MQDNQIINIKAIEALASNPMQMATRILALEKRQSEWKIGTDQNRRAGLLQQFAALADKSHANPEEAHTEADDLLLEFINDEEVTNAYGKIERYFG